MASKSEFTWLVMIVSAFLTFAFLPIIAGLAFTSLWGKYFDRVFIITDVYAVGAVFASYVNRGLELQRPGDDVTNTPILIKLLLFQAVCGSHLTTKNINYITFSGSGEPTLNEGIGDVVQFLKSHDPPYTDAWLQPVAPFG